MSSTDNITADYLIRKTSIGKLRRETDEIYKSLIQTIIDANNAGQAEIYYELPDTFETNTLEKMDLQLVVYSDIVERLEKARFTVTLHIKPTGDTILHVKWPSILDKYERIRRSEIIAKHLSTKPFK